MEIAKLTVLSLINADDPFALPSTEPHKYNTTEPTLTIDSLKSLTERIIIRATREQFGPDAKRIIEQYGPYLAPAAGEDVKAPNNGDVATALMAAAGSIDSGLVLVPAAKDVLRTKRKSAGLTMPVNIARPQ